MLKNIKKSLRRFTVVTRMNRLRKLSREHLDLGYRPEDITTNYYTSVAATTDKELEHQIGRLLNFKKIITEIKDNNIAGDVIEFGTWRGFSLLWTAYFIERQAIFNKQIIGLDSFDGLPNTEGIFLRGAFNDTSATLCRNNIFNSPDLYNQTKQNISIEKFLFSEEQALVQRVREITKNKFCYIHIDCDISSSLKEIFAILTKHDLLADTCYILFDDYGCMDSYKQTVDEMMTTLRTSFIVTEHSHTNLTKNFILTRK